MLYILRCFIWGFAKIGDPNIVPLNSRILIVRIPKIRYHLIFGIFHFMIMIMMMMMIIIIM